MVAMNRCKLIPSKPVPVNPFAEACHGDVFVRRDENAYILSSCLLTGNAERSFFLVNLQNGTIWGSPKQRDTNPALIVDASYHKDWKKASKTSFTIEY